MKTLIDADYQRFYGRPPSILRLVRAYALDAGFKATILHRFASRAWRANHIRLGLAIAAHAIKVTGADVQPGARVGPGLVIRHPVGVVVGVGVTIGANCTLLQGSTLGERLMPQEDHRYPVLGDNVTICAGAVVIGGISIGSGAVVGANSVVLSDVPAGAVAVGAPARLFRQSVSVGQ